MARPVNLFTGQWADLPLEVMARKTKQLGYDGVELACWEHSAITRALANDRRKAAPASRRDYVQIAGNTNVDKRSNPSSGPGRLRTVLEPVLVSSDGAGDSGSGDASSETGSDDGDGDPPIRRREWLVILLVLLTVLVIAALLNPDSPAAKLFSLHGACGGLLAFLVTTRLKGTPWALTRFAIFNVLGGGLIGQHVSLLGEVWNRDAVSFIAGAVWFKLFHRVQAKLASLCEWSDGP